MHITEVLRVTDRDYVYYLGTIDPSQILQLTYVPCEVPVASLANVLNIRHEGGYQREGNVNRMKKIKEHYASSNIGLIPPVLLSPRGKWKFTPINSKSNFGMLEADDCAAIIDGQHRLGGLSLISSDDSLTLEQKSRKIPFMAVEFESDNIEKKQFEIINDEQKGIPKSHLKFINREASTEAMIAFALKDESESVFYQRIGVASRSDWDLVTFGAVEEIVSYTFDDFFITNAFKPKESDHSKVKAINIAIKYWQLVKECFPEMWSDMQKMPTPGIPKSPASPGRAKFKYRLLEETGLKAFGKLGSRLLNHAYMQNSGDVAWETVRQYLMSMASEKRLNLALQKKNKENATALIELDPGLQFQGNAGVPALWRIVEGAFENCRR